MKRLALSFLFILILFSAIAQDSASTAAQTGKDEFEMPTWIVAIMSAAIGAVVGPVLNIFNSNKQRKHERMKFEWETAIKAMSAYNHYNQRALQNLRRKLSFCNFILQPSNRNYHVFHTADVLTSILEDLPDSERSENFHVIDIFLEPDDFTNRTQKYYDFWMHVKRRYNECGGRTLSKSDIEFIEDAAITLEELIRMLEEDGRKIRKAFRHKFHISLSMSAD